jgi:glucose-1-phosphate cytidylyltransferase
VPLDEVVREFHARRAVASFVSVRPAQSFHVVNADEAGYVKSVGAIAGAPIWINGGYFVLRQEIFDVMEDGEELVEAPFARLIARRKLTTYRYDGFWQSMDTFKDKITLDRMEARGHCPWMVWDQRQAGGRARA